MIVILAFNAKQATEFASRHGWSFKQWVYVTRSEQLMGLENPEVYKLNGWMKNIPLDEVEAILNIIPTRIRPTATTSK